MKLTVLIALCLLLPIVCRAQLAPPISLSVSGAPVSAFAGGWPACDGHDLPDAPARAIRLADGAVQLYVSDQINRINTGPDLLHLRHGCAVVYRGGWNDDPAAFNDRTWIATPWTADGKTIWAVLHNEFHGHARKALCPTGRYMDCWYNALTMARSIDGGQTFQRLTGNALVAAVPYRYDEVGIGHHGYFNPSNIVRHDGADYMFAFATRTALQREVNCLMRTNDVSDPTSWRAWDGSAFTIGFDTPYVHALIPEHHICAPVGAGALRWPVTSLVRHAGSGTYIATMQDASRGGGTFYATSADLIHWSPPIRLLSAPGLRTWVCGDPDPIAYPALIDPASNDRNFQTVGATPELFATRFDVEDCRITTRRTLVRWPIQLMADESRRRH